MAADGSFLPLIVFAIALGPWILIFTWFLFRSLLFPPPQRTPDKCVACGSHHIAIFVAGHASLVSGDSSNFAYGICTKCEARWGTEIGRTQYIPNNEEWSHFAPKEEELAIIVIRGIETTADEILRTLTKITPGFSPPWHRADAVLTHHGVFSEYRRFFGENFDELTARQRRELAALIVRCLRASDAGANVAASASFLNAPPINHLHEGFVQDLDNEARDYFGRTGSPITHHWHLPSHV